MTLIAVLVVAAFLPFALFVAAYARLRWWDTPAGRSVMVLAVVCTLALGSPLYRELSGERLPDWVRAALFAVVIVAGWWQLLTLLVVQRRARQEARR